MKVKILIVEDDEFTSEGLKSVLEDSNYDVDLASNGLIAVDKIKSSEYHLIITDLMMPVMDGIQLLNRLKDICNSIPVIIITAYDNIENMLTAYQFGVVEILDKPFDISELLDLVEEIIEIKN